MKRILIYSTAYFPLVGGAEVAVKEITDRLPEYEFDLITARIESHLPKQEKIGAVNVFRMGIGSARIDKILLALFGGWYGAKLHAKKKYDLAWSIMASFGGFAAFSFSKKTGVPYLLTLQEGDSLDSIVEKVRWIRWRFAKIFSSAAGLQAISHYLMQWGKKMGFHGRIAEVVPNGVDVGRFTQRFDEAVVSHMRQSFQFRDNAVVVVTASRLVEKNGIEYVIRALALIPEKFCFVICGTGALEESLKNLVSQLGLEKRVRFLGNISHEELRRVLAAADIFIRPSLSEGLGNSFLEAMASGLPTIGTRVGGIPDFLREGETGFFCQPQDPQSIASTLQKVDMISSEEKNKIFQQGIKQIVETYNWDTIAKRMRKIFETI